MIIWPDIQNVFADYQSGIVAKDLQNKPFNRSFATRVVLEIISEGNSASCPYCSVHGGIPGGSAGIGTPRRILLLSPRGPWLIPGIVISGIANTACCDAPGVRTVVSGIQKSGHGIPDIGSPAQSFQILPMFVQKYPEVGGVSFQIVGKDTEFLRAGKGFGAHKNHFGNDSGEINEGITVPDIPGNCPESVPELFGNISDLFEPVILKTAGEVEFKVVSVPEEVFIVSENRTVLILNKLLKRLPVNVIPDMPGIKLDFRFNPLQKCDIALAIDKRQLNATPRQACVIRDDNTCATVYFQ